VDDRTFALVLAVLASSMVVIIVAGVAKFDVSPGFWAIPGGVITLLTVRAAGKGNGNGREDPTVVEARRKLKEFLDQDREKKE